MKIIQFLFDSMPTWFQEAYGLRVPPIDIPNPGGHYNVLFTQYNLLVIFILITLFFIVFTIILVCLFIQFYFTST